MHGPARSTGAGETRGETTWGIRAEGTRRPRRTGRGWEQPPWASRAGRRPTARLRPAWPGAGVGRPGLPGRLHPGGQPGRPRRRDQGTTGERPRGRRGPGGRPWLLGGGLDDGGGGCRPGRLVLDGGVRDVVALEAHGFPVFSRPSRSPVPPRTSRGPSGSRAGRGRGGLGGGLGCGRRRPALPSWGRRLCEVRTAGRRRRGGIEEAGFFEASAGRVDDGGSVGAHGVTRPRG